MLGLDPLYWMMIIPTILFALWAQFRVKSAYTRWSQEPNSRGMTGAEAAADMLVREGVTDVQIEMVDGWLSDHYDPTAKVLRLSPDNYNGRSIAAVGIACHEAGHALQHAHGYAFLGLRSLLVPTASIGSWLSFPLILLGIVLASTAMLKLGVILFGLVVLFQLVTLPVEFNASSRAKLALAHSMGMGGKDEVDGVNDVLDAAAMTYVAAALSALANLLYYVIVLTRGQGED